MSDATVATRDSKGFDPGNRLLAVWREDDLSGLRPHLEAAPLEPGRILFEADAPLARLYFVETGVVSLLTVPENRAAVGVTAVGREGALGRAQVLVPGSSLVMEVPAFRRALRGACQRFTRALLVGSPLARLHTAEQRCARWLLMCPDRTEEDSFELTSESLAEMVARP